MGDKSPFKEELERLINKYCLENASGTPDFILAQYLWECLMAFDTAVTSRMEWSGIPERPQGELDSLEG